MGVPLAAYLTLAVPGLLTRLPFSDEGWFTIPAHYFAVSGRMVNPVVVPAQPYHLGMDRWFTQDVPLHVAQIALVFRGLGPGVVPSRLPSLAWGLVLVAAVAAAAFRGTGSGLTALVCGLLVATDFSLLAASASARPDLACLGAGLTGIVVFWSLRREQAARAALLGGGLVAVGMLFHPNGVLAAGILAGVSLLPERGHPRGLPLVALIAPFAAAGLVLAWHLSHDLDGAVARMAVHLEAADQLGSGWLARYAGYFGLLPPYDIRSLVKAVPLLVATGAAVAGSIDRRWAPAGFRRALLGFALACLAFLAFVTPSKGVYYLPFATVPVLLVCGAWIGHSISKSGPPRVVAIAALALLVPTQLARTAGRVAGNEFQVGFLPVVRHLRAYAKQDDLVYASREFFVELVNCCQVRDDYFFGAKTGIPATWVVLEKVATGPAEGWPSDPARVTAAPARYSTVLTTTTHALLRAVDLELPAADR
jgi:hypothetical protein